MKSVTKDIKKIMKDRPIFDAEKLEKQQEYHEKMVKAGLVKKQKYNIKPLSYF